VPDRNPVGHQRCPRKPLPSFGSTATAILAIFLVALVSACGRQVAVEPPNPVSAYAGQQCAGLSGGLPQTVDGAGRRPTTPDATSTAAWGEPPIVLRCGVQMPTTFSPTSTVVEVAGITWFPEELTAGVLFTAVDWPSASQPVFVEIAIPDRYESTAAIITDISVTLQVTSP
jgi:hypothetical protein